MMGSLFYKVFSNIYLRFVEFVGITVSFMAMAGVVAVISYCPDDPSWNTAISTGKAANLLSFVGSYYADIMVQMLGVASFVFSLILMFFGYQLLKYHVVSFYRVLCGLLACIAASVLCAALKISMLNSGYLGNYLWSVISSIPTLRGVDTWVTILAIFVIFAVLIVVAGRLKLDSVLHLGEMFDRPDEIIHQLINTEADNFELTVQTAPSAKMSKADKPSDAKKGKKQSGATKARGFTLPSVKLLKEATEVGERLSDSELRNLGSNLINVLDDFGIKGEITGINPGPVVTLYELKPAAGIKSSRVIGLASDIARYMSAVSARVSVMSGRNALGIELPNAKRQTVYLREVFESNAYHKSPASLPIALGKDISGKPVVADLALMPHLLIAGTTGSGKSVGINAMILSLLYKLTPDECKFIMVDPKMLELSIYDDIPHLLTPVVTDPKKAVVALKWAVREMESRYMKMSKIGVRNISGYNAKLASLQKSGEPLTRRIHTGFDQETGAPIYETQAIELEPLPYIVIVVDEMADLMLVAGKDIEVTVQRLAQMARAAGIHLIMATQRPSVDVITGTIKANFPTRISYHVSSKIDSRTILGEQGAEQLLGQGDMLYLASGGRMTRIHCPFVSDSEVEKIVNSLKEQGEPHYITTILDDDECCVDDSAGDSSGDDPMYKDAVSLVLREGKASTSFIQRHLKIGYNRAARIIDMMEAAGIVSAANHVGKREILSK